MDKKIRNTLDGEEKRQIQNIELIASENFVSKDIMELQGSVFTNKYAEGYPGKRYYGGCEHVDAIESLAIEYAKELFKCKYANVQPHSGAIANLIAYRTLISHGDKIMGMNLSHGGHLTHGHPKNFSGFDYEIIPYNVNLESEMIDYDELESIAMKERPQMIIAGASAYSRDIDFKKFRSIADKCGAYLVVDMAHIAGLVAAGLHGSPIPYADIVTSTTHKTLRGPRAGLILTNDEVIAKKIDSMTFPGIQGGPLMHVIAAKAQCFYEALQPEFIEYQRQVLKNAKAFSEEFMKNNFRVISGGTDNHLFLLDTKTSFDMTGKDVEELLDKVHITVNKNTIPGDTESPFVTSGIRLGTPAMTTKGFKEEDFIHLADIIINVLQNKENQIMLDAAKYNVQKLTKKCSF